MYNEKQKREYLRYVSEDLNKSTQNIYNIFKNLESYEAFLNKDLCNFVLNEIEKALMSLNPSSEMACRKNLSIMKTYTTWCCNNMLSIDNINHYSEIQSKNIGNYINKELSKMPTREEILEDIKTLENFSDRFLILAVFEGIRPFNIGELLRAQFSKIENIDSQYELLLEDDTKVIMSNELYALAAGSYEEEVYISTNGTESILSRENCIVHSRTNVRSNTIDALNKRCTDRFRAIRKEDNFIYATIPKLYASGLIDNLKNISEEEGVDKEELFTEKYFKLCNPNFNINAEAIGVFKIRFGKYFE